MTNSVLFLPVFHCEAIVSTLATAADIYRDGSYLVQHPLWHTEHAAWKAAHVIRMVRRSNLRPRSVCDVGCGAGEVLRHVQNSLGSGCELKGFDISPQAIQLCQSRANRRLQFVLIEDDEELRGNFDLLISVDVIEHVEDWIGHLRRLRGMAVYKIFHVPLDLSVHSVLRRDALAKRRESHGHLHYFTKDTFLRALTDLGYDVRDVAYTKRSLAIGSGLTQAIANLPRRVGFMICQDLTVRIFGGFSLAVLAV